MNRHDTEWRRKGIFYQIHPRSFQDTDGDGIGDIEGITARLPYLEKLGINAVCVCNRRGGIKRRLMMKVNWRAPTFRRYPATSEI